MLGGLYVNLSCLSVASLNLSRMIVLNIFLGTNINIIIVKCPHSCRSPYFGSFIRNPPLPSAGISSVSQARLNILCSNSVKVFILTGITSVEILCVPAGILQHVNSFSNFCSLFISYFLLLFCRLKMYGILKGWSIQKFPKVFSSFVNCIFNIGKHFTITVFLITGLKTF